MPVVLKRPPRQDLINRHRWTVEDYYRLARTGILDERSRVELIEGEVVDMTPIGSAHANLVDLLARLFILRLDVRCRVRVQNPICLDAHNEPQPDLVLAADRDYAAAHPQAADVFLIVEIADTSLAYDREIKLPLYARHGIPEVWLLDVSTRQLSVYRHPEEGRYRLASQPSGGERLEILGLPGVTFGLDEIVRV
jgi:Uma2 family endonuclease